MPPDPSPSTIRPPESTSIEVAILAIWYGVRNGSTATPVPNRMCRVRCAADASRMKASSVGSVSSSGTKKER